MHGEIEEPTIMVGDFNTFLSEMKISNRDQSQIQYAAKEARYERIQIFKFLLYEVQKVSKAEREC